MPKKIRELKQQLHRAGFREIPGKGSHSNWVHQLYTGKVTIAGKDGTDAKLYQEREVQQALQEVIRRQKDEQT